MNASFKDVSELNGNFEVDGSHSSVEFSVVHVISSTKGSVNIDSGYVNLQNANGPKIFVQLDMTSLNTQSEMRDDHLKDKPEFFDVAKFKKASFEATEIVKDTTMGAEYRYIAKGKLTLKGVTKDANLSFNYLGSKTEEQDGSKINTAGFEGKTVINRKDFGVGTSLGIGEDVTINVSLEAAQAVK